MNVFTLDHRHSQRQNIINDLGLMGDAVDFKTHLEDMYISDNGLHVDRRVSGKKVLLNSNTGEQLSVVGDNYHNPLSHAEQFRTVERNIVNSKLDLSEMTRTIDVSHNGARAYARWTFPAHQIDVGGTGLVNLEVLSRNSFDNTWPTVMEGGAYRLVCTNLMVLGTVIAYSKQRHTKNINYEGGAIQVMNCLTAFMAESEKWNHWYNTKITDAQAFRIFAKVCDNKHALASSEAIEDGSANLYDVLDKATKNKDGSDKKRGGLTNLWRLWRFHYKPGIGDNLWSLYNVLTDWATHHQGTTSTSSNNLVALQTKASKEVKDLVVKDNLFRLAA